MSKPRIAIDTSILRGDGGLSSGPMQALARFAANGHIEILIPEMVAREFTTKRSAKIRSLEDLRETLKRLKNDAPNELHAEIASFERSVNKEFDRQEALAKQRFDAWQQHTGAIIVPFAEHTAKVMDKYFSGAPPFKHLKAREDLPDAFIVETMLDLTSAGPLFVLVADGRLGDALAKSPGITVFRTAKAFLASQEFDDALGDLDEIEEQNEHANIQKVVMEFLEDNSRFHKSLAENVSRLVSGRTLHYRNPHNDDKEGQEEIYIASVQEVYEWNFDSGHEPLGEGVVLVNFQASAEIEADDSGGDWRDDEGNLDSSRTVTVLGAVSISLKDDDISRDPARTTGKELLNAALVSIDELDDISLNDRPY